MAESLRLTNYPLLFLVISFIVMWMSAEIGRSYFRKRFALEDELRGDYGFILGAALTLLGLIIGFTFSMATERYDQRENYEAQEASAIRSEYLRADLLPAADGEKIRALLKKYLDQRIQFYMSFDERAVRQINDSTTQLQAAMWSTVVASAAAHPGVDLSLAVSGMNDVLISQGNTQASWWNRIPVAAWVMMAAIAIGCNVLIGYGSQGTKSGTKLLLILPIFVAVAFMMIADIDAPTRGIIRLNPQNLTNLAESLGSP